MLYSLRWFLLATFFLLCLSPTHGDEQTASNAKAEQTSQQTQATEQDQPPAPDPLTTEAQQLLKKIAATIKQAQELMKQQSQTSGDDYSAYGRRITQRQLQILNDLNELCNNVIAQEKKQLDVSATRKATEDYLLRVGKAIMEYIDRVEESKQATKNSRLALTENERQNHLGLDVLYKALLELIKSKEKLGMDADQEREFLKRMLTSRAERLAGRIELNSDKEAEFSERLNAEPGNADLQLELLEIKEKLSTDVKSLAVSIKILRQVGVATDSYQKVLIRSTGDITSGMLDKKVIMGLLHDWLDETKAAIKMHGTSLTMKLLLFLLILFIFKILSKIVGHIVHKSVYSSNLTISHLLQDMIVDWSTRIVMIIGILMALSQVGVSLGPLLAGLGVAGFIIGFSLQDTLGNFAAGMMILLYRPYDVGDFVDIAGVFGKVESMSLVSTTILTIDNQTLVIPNSKIWGDVIKNISNQEMRRVDLVFGISYQDDIVLTENILKDIIDQHPKVLSDPEPTIKLHKLGESSVDFIVRPWVLTADYWDVYWDVTREVKMRFDRESISIPFPQRDVHLYPASSAP